MTRRALMTKCDFAPVKLPSLSVQAKRKKSETSLLDRVLWCLPGDLASSGQGARSSERPVLPPRLLNPMVAKAPWTCTSPHLRPALGPSPVPAPDCRAPVPTASPAFAAPATAHLHVFPDGPTRASAVPPASSGQDSSVCPLSSHGTTTRRWPPCHASASLVRVSGSELPQELHLAVWRRPVLNLNLTRT